MNASLDLPDHTPLQFSVYAESDTIEFHEAFACETEDDAMAIAETLYGWGRHEGIMISVEDHWSGRYESY